MKLTYISSISESENLVGLAPKAREKMETVTELFPFSANQYYLSLIDWKDGHDRLRRSVTHPPRIPDHGGSADPSYEKTRTRKTSPNRTVFPTGLLSIIDFSSDTGLLVSRRPRIATGRDTRRHSR